MTGGVFYIRVNPNDLGKTMGVGGSFKNEVSIVHIIVYLWCMGLLLCILGVPPQWVWCYLDFLWAQQCLIN